MSIALLGYYAITPTHCGTGQAADAVDLPIAREAHTKHPIWPATSLKGAIRAAFEEALGKNDRGIEEWFGRELSDEPRAEDGRELRAGSVTFSEGRLLAFPVRALHTTFCYVTCPLILERFDRDLRAHDLEKFWTLRTGEGALPWDAQKAEVYVATTQQTDRPLVLEDLAFERRDVVPCPKVAVVARAFASLLPANEKPTKARLESHLIVLRDDLFQDLVRRTTPVQARVHLDDNKTTSGAGGNLWYEETLPADSLLAAFLNTRKQRTSGGGGASGSADDWDAFLRKLKRELSLRPLQIGGNETVGQGLCLWHVWEER